MSRPATTRVQLQLPRRAMTRLRSLQDRTEAASYAEVMKNALRLYEALIDAREAGDDVIVRRRLDGGESSVFSEVG